MSSLSGTFSENWWYVLKTRNNSLDPKFPSIWWQTGRRYMLNTWLIKKGFANIHSLFLVVNFWEVGSPSGSRRASRKKTTHNRAFNNNTIRWCFRTSLRISKQRLGTNYWWSTLAGCQS
jgi:hypothetical protein